MLAWALNRLRAVGITAGRGAKWEEASGRLRPSAPIGSFARTMTPSCPCSACKSSMPGHVVHES